MADLFEWAARCFKLQDAYDRAKAKADEAEAALKACKAEGVERFTKDELKEIRTKRGFIRLRPKIVPQIDAEKGGWEAFYGHIVRVPVENLVGQNKKDVARACKLIAETGEWDLLQKRLGERACVERWENKVVIPGVKEFNTWVVRIGEEK